MNNIFLIGMMASGKTTIGKQLSKQLDREFIDIDQDLESINNMSISDIFNDFGEHKFREMEMAYFIEKTKEKNKIFSTGGGIILRKENREALISRGITFFLESDCNILLNRIKDIKSRPVLSNSNNSKSIHDIWQERKEYYYSSCNHIINVEQSSISDTTNTIIKILDANE